MAYLYQIYIYQPILQALIFIYHNLAFHDLGLAIIILTILIRIILLPLFYKGAKDQTLLQRLSPQIKKIQDDHKDNKEKQAKALMNFYREHRVNPFSGILLLILQLPIIIALYQVFLKGLSAEIFGNQMFLGLIDLGQKNLWLAAFAALIQFFYSRLSMASQPAGQSGQAVNQKTSFNPQASVTKMMTWMGPFLTLFILVSLPAAIGLYWGISTVFSLAQQLVINKKIHQQFK